MAIRVLLRWTQANSFELVVRQSHGRPQGRQTGVNPGGTIEAIARPKTCELTVFTRSVYNS